jgi:hypothetical protein
LAGREAEPRMMPFPSLSPVSATRMLRVIILAMPGKRLYALLLLYLDKRHNFSRQYLLRKLAILFGRVGAETM